MNVLKQPTKVKNLFERTGRGRWWTWNGSFTRLNEQETKDFIGKSCGTFCRRSIQTATRTMLRDFRALGPHILPIFVIYIYIQQSRLWVPSLGPYEIARHRNIRICTNKFGNSWTWSWWPLGLAAKRQGWLEIVAAFHTNLSVERDDVILAIPEVNMVIIRLYSLRHNLFQPSFKPGACLPGGIWPRTVWALEKMAGKMMRKEVSMGKKGGGSKVCAMTLLWNQVPWHSVEFTCKPCKLAQTFEALGSPRWFLWYNTDWSMFRVSVCLFLGSTIASLWLTTTYQFVINYVFCDGKT